MRRHRQQGFTLMELMVVIVIVAILAAVAVPLYINYVKDAQRTEAKGAIGAIVTAEQSFYQRSALSGAPKYGDFTELKDAGDLDIPEAEANWDFVVTPQTTPLGFTVKATSRKDASIIVDFEYTRTGGGTFEPGGGEEPPPPGGGES